MFQRHHIQRAMHVSAWAAAGLVLCTTPASAKDTKRACTPAYVAYKSAQDREKSGKIHEARDLLQTCMESTCGGLIPKCKALYEKLKAELPSVVLVVTDDSGNARSDVQVKMDGDLLTSKLDGMAIPVEPGMHEFSFSTGSGVFATQKILIVEGQRNRFISVSMRTGAVASTAPPASTEPKPAAEEPNAQQEKSAQGESGPDKGSHEETAEAASPSPGRVGNEKWAPPRSTFPYVLGGVGLAGVAAGGLLTLWGNKDNSQLESSCSPNCRPASLDHIRTMYIAADISLGVGAAALAVTTWLFASSRSAEKAPTKSATVLDVHPIPSGAFATVSGGF
jgi:hypothetical protein